MFKDQIETGAKLLDEKLGPVWLERQDLERLQLTSCFYCVVGQAFPDDDYIDVLKKLFNTSNEVEALEISEQYGFCIPDGVSFAEYPRLTLEWKAYITERRQLAKLKPS